MSQSTKPKALESGTPSEITGTLSKIDKAIKSTAINRIILLHRPDIDAYKGLYRMLHQGPDLARLEKGTADLVTTTLESFGFSVRRNVGGHGVIGILHNGPGPKVVLRAELDAQPVEEKTNLPYASTRIMAYSDGPEMPVMHAKGHDMHMAILLAAGGLLEEAKKLWRGSLILIFQPDADRGGGGAKSMIKDGLYQAIGPGQPDIILTQHITNHKAGTIQIGYDHVLAGKKAFFITIHGVGGHASKPHLCIDPVVIACSIVLKLQTIISRAVDPHDAAVVTCTSVATGREPNAIQDKAEITVDIRAFTTHTLNHVVKAMERVVKAECDDCEVAPTIVEFDNIPPLENDANATQAIEDQFRAYYGDEVVQQLGPNMASDDDLPLLAPEGVPCSYWTIRSTDPELWDKYNEEGRLNELPNVGDASFAPGEGREDTLRTGIDSLAMAALTFLDTRPNKDQN